MTRVISKPMGRPVTTGRQSKHRVTVRLSEEEAATVRRLARAAGCTVAEWLRRRGMGGERSVGIVDPETYAAAVKRAENAEALAKMASRSYGKGTLVSVDPAIIAALRAADPPGGVRHRADYADACETLADAVLAQLK